MNTVERKYKIGVYVEIRHGGCYVDGQIIHLNENVWYENGNAIPSAIEAKEEEEKALHEKLHNQLKDVVEILKAITSDKKGTKKFEIHLGNALFNVTLDDSECDCEEEILEKLGEL